MKRERITRTSDALGKDMSLIVYGEGGHPLIAFQPQGSKCNAFEDFGMVEALSDAIEAGTIQLFSVDNNDEESWSDTDGDKAVRAARQEAYFAFVTDELVPLVHELNGSEERPLAMGCSMGATHAALAALRRPDLFQGCIALSGIYDARYYFGDWMDSTLYDNSILSFLPNMAADHPYIALYGQRQLVFCVGQGAWEDQGIADLRVIADTCHEKGIDAWCDFWGYDVSHDWPWWKKQARYFLPIVLDDAEKSLAEERKGSGRKSARRTARTASTSAKAVRRGAKAAGKAVGKVADDAKDAVAAARKDAGRLARETAGAVEQAKTSAKRGADRAKSATRRAAEDARMAAEEAVADARASARKATARTKASASKVKSTTKATAAKAAGTAKAATRRAHDEAEKLAEEADGVIRKVATDARGAVGE